MGSLESCHWGLTHLNVREAHLCLLLGYECWANLVKKVPSIVSLSAEHHKAVRGQYTRVEVSGPAACALRVADAGQPIRTVHASSSPQVPTSRFVTMFLQTKWANGIDTSMMCQCLWRKRKPSWSDLLKGNRDLSQNNNNCVAMRTHPRSQTRQGVFVLTALHRVQSLGTSNAGSGMGTQ
jgi:hypothetical protein